LNSLTSVLNQIATAPDAKAVWQCSVDFFQNLGFHLINYGYTRFRSQKSMGDPEDALFMTNGSAEYATRYFNHGFYAKTPAFRWAKANVGACTWTWISDDYASGKLSLVEAETIRINQSLGIVAGITISFPVTSDRDKGAIGLVAQPGLTHQDVEEIFLAHGDELICVANMMHLRLIQFPFTIRRRALTERQREVLEWVADGKTTIDTAQIMNVSPAMVEKHLRLARETLGVETTAQAVAKAALMNLIFLSDARDSMVG
jgi:DNA-binding CsgD family transcriptional regulator